MALPSAPAFDAALRRMYHRREVESLGPHLEAACGVKDARLRQLDVGVFRVDHADRQRTAGRSRLFSERRPFGAAEGDLAVLCDLAEADFPAERPIAETRARRPTRARQC